MYLQAIITCWILPEKNIKIGNSQGSKCQLVWGSHLNNKMKFVQVIVAVVAACSVSQSSGTASNGTAISDRATYSCPEVGKDFYGNDIQCGYGLADDWKTCGKYLKSYPTQK